MALAQVTINGTHPSDFSEWYQQYFSVEVYVHRSKLPFLHQSIGLINMEESGKKIHVNMLNLSILLQ